MAKGSTRYVYKSTVPYPGLALGLSHIDRETRLYYVLSIPTFTTTWIVLGGYKSQRLALRAARAVIGVLQNPVVAFWSQQEGAWYYLQAVGGVPPT